MTPRSPIVLPNQRPLGLDQLPTSDLQHLASAHGAQKVWEHDRASLLSLVSNRTQHCSQKEYFVENAKGISPARDSGGMVSYNGELYIYGGLTHQYLSEDPDLEAVEQKKDNFMIRLDKNTNLWEPVSYKGAPRHSWDVLHSNQVGVVHGSKFYLTAPREAGEETFRVYDFSQKHWEIFSGNGHQPGVCFRHFLAVHEDCLLQYGGYLWNGEFVAASEAL